MSKNYIFKVTKRLRDANIAHRLLNYDGPCKNIHGHTYHFEVDISSNKLNELGMVIDFNEIKKICDNWIQSNWDHSLIVCDQDVELKKLINSISGGTKWFCFPKNTTAENMAAYLFSIFQKEFKDLGVKLEEVRIWETETSVATYRGE